MQRLLLQSLAFKCELAWQAKEDCSIFSSSSENSWSLPKALFDSSRRTGRQAGLPKCRREGLSESALPKKATKILRKLSNQSFHNLEIHQTGRTN